MKLCAKQDDALFAKENACCATLHFLVLEVWSPALWTLFYLAVSFVIFVGFILAGLATWKEGPHAMSVHSPYASNM